MNVTNDMAEAALDALDDACIGFQRSRNPSASVHWKGFTRDDRVSAMRTALSAALAKQDAAIALMRGQSEDRPRDAIDDDNGFRRYPWTYQNQPGNVGAWALGESASKAKPGGDPIDHGLSLLRELHLRGLGIVRVTKLKDPADEQ